MKQIVKSLRQPVLLGGLIATLLTYTSANAANTSNVVDIKNVTWQKQVVVDVDQLIDQQVPSDAARVFFIRAMDTDHEQTRVNLSINNRFQVSLHPGNFTYVHSCDGINEISAGITGLKSNDLMMNAQTYDLKAGNTYFFEVDVDTLNKINVSPVTQAVAKKMMIGKSFQSHQVSRVIKNCPARPIPATPQPAPPPVLKEPVSIELEVLFDNDKSVVKPEYYAEVRKVSDFMKKYSNTTAVIEGHTDSNASDDYNQALSQRRANAVKDALVYQYGIASDRLTAIGYGESRPIATNATDAGRQQNRRVVAVITEK